MLFISILTTRQIIQQKNVQNFYNRNLRRREKRNERTRRQVANSGLITECIIFISVLIVCLWTHFKIAVFLLAFRQCAFVLLAFYTKLSDSKHVMSLLFCIVLQGMIKLITCLFFLLQSYVHLSFRQSYSFQNIL